MKVFANVGSDLAARPPEAKVSAHGRSVWVGAAWTAAGGLAFLGGATIWRLIFDPSPMSRGIAGVVSSLAFFFLARAAGLMRKSNSSDQRWSLNLSPLMAQATGWAVMMTLIFIAVEQRVGYWQFFATGITWLLSVGLGTLARKLPGPPYANS